MKTEGNEHINLKVAGQDGSVVQFKIKRHTPLIKLMKAYCDRQVGLKSLNGQQHSLYIWVYTFSMLIKIGQKSIKVPTVGQHGEKYGMNADVYDRRTELHDIHTFSNVINTRGTECAKSHAAAATRILPVCPQFVSLHICCCCVYMVKTLGDYVWLL